MTFTCQTPRSAVPDNRLKTYNGTTYYYDHFGNLIHRELANGEVQNYFYDLHDQLVKAEIFKKDGTKETWSYTYDALGRRIGKGRLKDGEVSDGLEEETGFVWDGSHLLQEVQPDGRYTYIYTDPDSYEPLAQVHNWTNEEGESHQQTHYFHCDQIGIPREMTDGEGNLVWFGSYTGWGRLKEETKVTDSAYQPFRLQNQYADRETGLHYNFFRYYEPDAGRFINQDPIKYLGGANFYTYAFNITSWVDYLGLNPFKIYSRLRQIFNKANKKNKKPDKRDQEYQLAKRFCDTPVPPQASRCATLSAQINHAKRCIELYTNWDRKWQPGRHTIKINDWKNRLNDLKEKAKAECSR